MNVIFPSAGYSSREITFGSGKGFFQLQAKRGLELDLSPTNGGKVIFGQTGDYLSEPISVHLVEDALVPECSESSNILDLSTPTLDTPSIIESFVDVLPFRFGGPAPDPVPRPEDVLSVATASVMLGIEESNERFQDLTELITSDPPMPMVCSPTPLLSPTDSIYSDVTSGSPASLLSAASTSSDQIFFTPDFDQIASESSSIKFEDGERRGAPRVGRYAEMRRRNNIASKRSRLTRREKERDMEQQLKCLYDDNLSLKTKVKKLEALVEQTKRIIIQAVTKRNQQ